MRTRNLALMGRLATEEIEENAVVPGEEAATEPVEAGVDSLEADLTTVNDELVEVQDTETSTDEATEVVDELEVAAESLRNIAKNGGLDRNGSIILNLHLESLNRRVGLPDNHSVLSIESFGGTNSRIGNTQLAAESIAEKAKDLWKKIVEMFKKAIAAIVGLWNRIFDGATKMKARAENLVKAAEGMKNPGEAPKTFEQQKLAEQLHINGTVDAKVAAKEVNDVAMLLSSLTQSSLKAAESLNAAIESGDLAKLKGVAAEARKQLPSKVADPASVGLGAPGEGLELYREADAWPGNKALIAIVPASDDAKPEVVGKIAYKIGTFDASKKVAEKAQLATLSPSDVVAIAKQIANAADGVLKYKPEQKKSEEAGKKVVALAEKKANEAPAEGAEGGEGKLSGADARNLAKGAMALAIHAAPPIAVYALNAGGAVLQYGEQSLKQYGKSAKAEDKKPAEGAKAAAAA